MCHADRAEGRGLRWASLCLVARPDEWLSGTGARGRHLPGVRRSSGEALHTIGSIANPLPSGSRLMGERRRPRDRTALALTERAVDLPRRPTIN